MVPRPVAADAGRAAVLVGALTCALLDRPQAGLAFVLVAPAALALRFMPVRPWLDSALCGVLFLAQLGAVAGLTDATSWWDHVAHAATGALLAALVLEAGWTTSTTEAVIMVLGLGVAWEGVEWATDAVFATNFSAGVLDTTLDLLGDVTGAVVGALIVTSRLSRAESRHRTRTAREAQRSA